MATEADIAFVRTAEAPVEPPPPSEIGLNGWLLHNLVPNWWVALLAALFAVLVGSWVWGFFNWAVLQGVFTAENREGCIAPAAEGKPLGACWAYAAAKFGQWIYGFYPIELRWRPNLVFLLFFALLAPLLVPRAPWKGLNAMLFFVALPIFSFYVLYGTELPFAAVGFVGWLIRTVFTLIASVIHGISFAISGLLTLIGIGLDTAPLFNVIAAPFHWVTAGIDWVGRLIAGALGIPLAFWTDFVLSTAAVTALVAWSQSRTSGLRFASLARPLAAVLAIALLIRFVGLDNGLPIVETSQWGGLLVTLVIAVTGIVASLPIGIMLALGRRSKMPAIRFLSVIFIEMVRGVPLITVLFMASFMLPLFLPAGTNFDKLLRVLVGVALFSSAYMAEVVRGGLQAIPKGQYEAAQALGLSYWKMMLLVVLPQALKIVIPGIVNTFIGLFKDTTLVAIVGIFDILGIIQAGFADQKWVSPMTAPTGYLGAAAMFFVFCFGMSRYSVYIERRLATGHKR